MKRISVDWTVWKPRLLYGAFFAAALLLALRQTFPAEAVKERLVLEAAQRGWQVNAAEAGPAGLVGVALKDVTLKDREGLTIPVERIDATLAVGQLLLGRRRLAFDARLYDGRVRGAFDLGAGPQAVDLKVDGLDLAQAVPLRKAAGVDLAGVVSGTGRLVLPADEKAKAEGRLDLAVKDAGLAGGTLPVAGMAVGLTLPKVALGQVTAALKVEGGKGTFEKLAATGGDAELSGEGLYFMVQPRLEYAPVFGKLSFKLSDAFAAKPEVRPLKSLLDAALAGSKGRDGAYQLQLFGSLGHPQVRPAAGG
ncbi:MAG TPA: type II secretion system protein GspN [Anaeromyxobacteraceae bacterium]|nr:type II secretion system protein GspN [Anaeromyxobacteraceae bacterium]